jgi:hypothetical protein
VSINAWMDKENVVQVQKGILLNHKQEWNSLFVTTLLFTGGHYAWWNRLGTGKHKPQGLPHMWELIEAVSGMVVMRRWESRGRGGRGGCGQGDSGVPLHGTVNIGNSNVPPESILKAFIHKEIINLWDVDMSNLT